jgi:hypothetical protein
MLAVWGSAGRRGHKTLSLYHSPKVQVIKVVAALTLSCQASCADMPGGTERDVGAGCSNKVELELNNNTKQLLDDL